MSGGGAARIMFAAARIRRTAPPGTGAGSPAMWQQGSAELYTEELVGKRAAARLDPGVIDVLQKWWDTARRSMLASTLEVTEEPYIIMMKKIYRVVIEEYDEEDATACACDDWARDAKGRAGLTREMFMDSLFELCALHLPLSLSIALVTTASPLIQRNRLLPSLAGPTRGPSHARPQSTSSFSPRSSSASPPAPTGNEYAHRTFEPQSLHCVSKRPAFELS